MKAVFLDSNVLIDVITNDAQWASWSSSIIEKHAHDGILILNPIVYAEVSLCFNRIEDFDELLDENYFKWADLPKEACFLAAKCFLNYKKRGGKRTSTLPDFFIGAHASILGVPLATRDVARYKTYYPKLKLICP